MTPNLSQTAPEKEVTPAIEDAQLNADLTALAVQDQDIAEHLKRLAPILIRRAPEGIATLVRIILGQQVSTKAASTLFVRLQNACGDEINPTSLLALGDAGLRAQGLSGRKASYTLDLAQAIATGQIDPTSWPALDDQTVTAQITSQRGLGPWTADIYLMFALKRRDIMPAEDLAIRAGYAKLKGLNEPPSIKELRDLTQPWQPYRSAAAMLLWRVYGATTLDIE